MKSYPVVGDYMTPSPHSIGFDQSVETAQTLMRRYNIRHLPVQCAGELIGIVSDRDIKFALAWERNPERQLSVEDVYIPDPFVVAPTTPLENVVAVMAEGKIGSALVLENKKLVGIFTTTDACRAFYKKLVAGLEGLPL